MGRKVEGKRAYQRGTAREDNPHLPGSTAQREWADGWDDARFEHEYKNQFLRWAGQNGTVCNQDNGGDDAEDLHPT